MFRKEVLKVAQIVFHSSHFDQKLQIQEQVVSAQKTQKMFVRVKIINCVQKKAQTTQSRHKPLLLSYYRLDLKFHLQ